MWSTRLQIDTSPLFFFQSMLTLLDRIETLKQGIKQMVIFKKKIFSRIFVFALDYVMFGFLSTKDGICQLVPHYW